MAHISRITLIILLPLSFSCSKKQGKNLDLALEKEARTEVSSFAHEMRDTFLTGAPIPVRSKWIDPDSVAKPKTIPLRAKPKVTPAKTNTIPAGNPKVTPVPTNLTIITPGKNHVPLPREFRAKGRAIPALQTPPVPALTPEMKDYAKADIQYLDVNHGLKSHEIKSIMQDRRGYLWIGSVGGVSRYDGSTFVHYTSREGLINNTVFSILEDSLGNIWFGTQGGISKYDGVGFTYFMIEEKLMGNQINCMLEDAGGNIWFGTEVGAFRYDGSVFTLYTKEEGLSDNFVQSILEDVKGNLWFGTRSGGLNQFKDASFIHYTTREGLKHNDVRHILEDSRQNLWIGTFGGGLSRYDPNAFGGQGSFIHYTTKEGLFTDRVRSILEDEEGHLWFGVGGGAVSKFDPDAYNGQGSFIHYTAAEGLSNGNVWTVMEDNLGNIWAGTFGGLNRLNSRSFTQFTPPGQDDCGCARFMIEDRRNNLWFATYQGVKKYDGAGITHYTTKEGLSHDWVWFILEDSKGDFWFATYGGGVTRFDGTGFTHYTTKEGLSHNRVTCMLEDSAGNYWFGTEGGVSKYDGVGFTQYTSREGLSNDRVWSILEDNKHNLWFGTDWGVTRYDGVNFTQFTRKEGLSNDGVWSILEDSLGNIWFGTTGDGLYQYNSNSDQDTFTRYTTQEGLGDNFVLSIVALDQNKICVATQKDITFLHPVSGDASLGGEERSGDYQFFSFDKRDGLNTPYFNQNSVFLDSQNHLWWGSMNGTTILDLNYFKFPEKAPVIRLNTIEIKQTFVDYRRLSDSAYQHSIPFGAALVETFDSVASFCNYPLDMALPYNLNHLIFQFSAIDWAGPHKLKYSYQMEGLEEQWSSPTSTTRADYRNLSPGDYTFKVKAIGSAQVWSESFEYHFSIRPPWWLTMWAKGFYVLALLAIFYSLYLLRTREQRKKIARQEKELKRERQVNEKLKKIDLLKDQFLANTSHELRTPLQGIIGISESLYDEAEKVTPEILRENLAMTISSGKRLNNLVNDILDFSKLKNFDIQLLQKPVGIHALVDVVLKNNTPLVKGKSLELINAVPEDLPAAFADENRLQQILYNLVGNAVKFTETGHVKVSALEKENCLQISVADAGIGIPENKREAIFQEFEQGDASTTREFAGTGLGLSISKRLAELHGGQMWVESTVGQGSTFFFTLPVSTVEATTLTPAREATGLARQPSSIIKASAEGADASPRKDQRHSSIRILVVDDEPINQQVLKNHLSGKGFLITQAMNGEEAIKAIQNAAPFDLVLLDVMMPRMSGYEVCQKIREKYLPSELPVIMVTAKNQLQDIVQGLSYGANDYLPKPFQKEELLARINTQLDLHLIFSVADRFVPNEFLHSLNRKRLTEVMLGDHTEKEVTVLFTDIRDYTTLAETMTPEENFNFINAFHGRIGPVVQQHGGFINQYLGDGVMAIFPSKPEEALRAAVDMQKVVRQYNVQRQNQNRQRLKIGVGLHSGPLIMGIIGDQNRMDAATIADAVNLASRLEGLTKYYGASILLSEDTVGKMDDKTSFHFRYLGKIVVKGKKEPVGLYECYDGDAPETAAQKAATQYYFEKGLEQFLNREFPQAVATFDNVLKINAEDQPARLFMNKSSEYLLKGVPDDWTGVEVMTFK